MCSPASPEQQHQQQAQLLQEWVALVPRTHIEVGLGALSWGTVPNATNFLQQQCIPGSENGSSGTMGVGQDIKLREL